MKQNGLLLFFISPLFCLSQETVFYNANIFTADPQKPFAEAIAINGKIITTVGNYNEVKKKAGAHAEWVDMKGGFLMPGLIDTHNHAVEGGFQLTKPNANDIPLGISELLAYAKEELKKKTGLTGDVLVIYGINISTWKSLDEIIRVFNSDEFTAQPVLLGGSDGHTAWCNNVLLQRNGISKNYIESLTPEEKYNFGTRATGDPNGFLKEEAYYKKVEASLEKETNFNRSAALAIDHCNQLGITAWLDPHADNFLEAYRYLRENKKLTAHVAALLLANADAAAQPQIDKARTLQKKYNGADFSIIGFKVFADGVIEYPTQTAALSIAYTGTSSKGALLFNPKKFARFAAAADKNNLLVHVHAIGDRAVTETLNGFETMRRTNQNYTIPHIITHLQIVQPSDFTRFKQLNILTSFQLFWALADPTTIDIVKPYIDPSLYQWQYPARSMLQAGVTITGASDWPVTTANPFEAIYHAETRKGSMGVLDSTQCMPRLAMLYAYTSEAAKALRMEKSIGSLQAGKFADMILLDRDVLTVTPEAMMNTRVRWTMFEGKKIYEAAK
ncbi:MAG: amidohydrolase [Chitinophagaceae bacterium]